MAQSILTSIKKMVQIGEDDTSFDLDVTIFINSALADLHSLGVGPAGGYTIEDTSETWEDFLEIEDEAQINQVKKYVYLKVRQVFDPPTTAHLITAFEKMIQESEFRISVAREDELWLDPDPPVELEEVV